MSVVAYSPNKAEALAYIKWFAQPDVQKKWWALGGYSAHKAVLNDPGFAKTAPFAADFLTAMGEVVDFWAEPSYAQLLLAEQKRVHDYVVANKGTAKEALDALIKDWQKVFKDDGKLN
jgi:multiple sugar transport system substrate-binding protein